MAYRTAGVPDNPFGALNPMTMTPETIAANPSANPITALFAKLMGGVPETPVSTEAAGAMNPAEAASVERGTGNAGAMSIISKLAMLGSLLSGNPGMFVGGMLAKGAANQSESATRTTITGAEARAKQKRAEQYLSEVEQRKNESEGLFPTPAGAVPNYMTLGEARGRMANAAEDKASASQAKLLAKLEGTLVPLAERIARGEQLSESEWSSFEYLLKAVQSLRPYPAVMPWAQPGAPEAPARPTKAKPGAQAPATAPQATSGAGKPLTGADYAAFMNAAKGDSNKARAMAKQAGFDTSRVVD